MTNFSIFLIFFAIFFTFIVIISFFEPQGLKKPPIKFDNKLLEIIYWSWVNITSFSDFSL